MADQGAEGLLSPFLRRRRINMASLYLKGRILDVGCGSGELARQIKPDNYVGHDKDAYSIALAKKNFTAHRFSVSVPSLNEKFDTIVSLAVIEHVAYPVEFLRSWSIYLKDTKSQFVLTTPHPRIEIIHAIGSRIGLFSKHGNEEHEQLIDHKVFERISQQAGLKIIKFEKFLMGMNQLFVLKKNDL